MNLKNITLYALIGYTYLFVMRAIGTIFPATNYDFTWLVVEVLLNLIANLGITLFFLYLLKEFVHDDEVYLLNSTVVAFLGTLAILLVNSLNGISSILNMPIDHSASGRYLVNMLTWVHGFIIVLFFINLTESLRKRKSSKLFKPVLWAAGGSLTAFLLHSNNLLNYYYFSTRGRIFLDLDKDLLMIPGVLLITFSYISMIYFLICFHERIEKN